MLVFNVKHQCLSQPTSTNMFNTLETHSCPQLQPSAKQRHTQTQTEQDSTFVRCTHDMHRNPTQAQAIKCHTQIKVKKTGKASGTFSPKLLEALGDVPASCLCRHAIICQFNTKGDKNMLCRHLQAAKPKNPALVTWQKSQLHQGWHSIH